MMSFSYKHTFLVLLLATLMGCQQEPFTVSYLMQHPKMLKEQLARCQDQANKTQAQIQRCDVVYQATEQFMQLLNEQQRDPERFGQKILTAETNLVAAKQAVDRAQLQINQLTGNTNGDVLQKARSELERAQSEFKKQHEQLQTMLAIVGINSPE